MEYLILIALHVFFGILWAGGAVMAGFFIIPSVLEAGPAAGPVMAGVARRRMPAMLAFAATIVVVSGARLYMLKLTPEWFVTKEGLALSLGGLLALGAFVMGLSIQKPAAERLGALSAQIAASGAPPTPAQTAELQALRTRLGRMAKIIAWHLLVAAFLMATHRLVSVL